MAWSWEYFIEKDGKNPVKEHLATLQPKGEVAARLATIIRVNLEARDGPLIEKKYIFKPIFEFWQMRADDCRIIGKVYPGKVKRFHFVLLHSFVKKCDQTPPGEIEAARKAWSEFQRLEIEREEARKKAEKY